MFQSHKWVKMEWKYEKFIFSNNSQKNIWRTIFLTSQHIKLTYFIDRPDVTRQFWCKWLRGAVFCYSIFSMSYLYCKILHTPSLLQKLKRMSQSEIILPVPLCPFLWRILFTEAGAWTSYFPRIWYLTAPEFVSQDHLLESVSPDDWGPDIITGDNIRRLKIYIVIFETSTSICAMVSCQQHTKVRILMIKACNNCNI